jgi:hypothetical protein
MINKIRKIKRKFLIIGIVITVVLSILIICGLFLRKQWAEPSALESLRSLPYASWSKEEANLSKAGVVQNNTRKTFKGYQLLTDNIDEVFLMNMKGKVVNTWYLPYRRDWSYTILEDTGDLVAMDKWYSYIKLDWFSNIIWYIKLTSHHDIEKLPDGSYLILDKILYTYKSFKNVYFDIIKHISKDGKLLEEWSTFEHLSEIQKYHHPIALDKLPGYSIGDPQNAKFDYYHLNTIKVLPENPLGKEDKRFQQGNWITCFRNADLIVILDKDTKEIVWHWGPGKVDWPHMPYMLDNGEILIFDNGTHRTDGTAPAYSKVIQVNPVNYEITWEYKTDPPQKFFSQFRGSAQRFPNGNTLITEADSGHVFEVTQQGETVWDFYNPIFNAQNKRKLIYRMLRYPKETVKNLIKQYSKKHESVRKDLIINGDIEQRVSSLNNIPYYWFTEFWEKNSGIFVWDSTCAKSGDKCLNLNNELRNDSRWIQGIRVKPQTAYKLSGWIKTENVQYLIGEKWYSRGESGGAHLCVEHLDGRLESSRMISATQDWKHVVLIFETDDEDWIYLQARLGTYGGLAKGKAWYDDINLKETQKESG